MPKINLKPILSLIKKKKVAIPLGILAAPTVAGLANQAAVATGNEPIRNTVAGITSVATLPQRLMNRANATITNYLPWFTREKADIPKGIPVVTVDKGNHLARYYDASGKQIMTSPVGTGLIPGQKHKSGDNKTPTGTFSLGSAESSKNKKGGYSSFGNWFFRTNHTNDDGSPSGVGLHGTGWSFLNGGDISHGCIRADNDFINKLHDLGGARKIIIYDKKGGKIR